MWKLKNIFNRERKLVPWEFFQIIAVTLREGGVGVLPTDTLYGICGSALKAETVEKIYKLRKRELKKPMIVLLASTEDLELFDVQLTAKQQQALNALWPGKVSVVLPCANKKFVHLNRGGKTVAFRMPKEKGLLKLLQQTGPLVAPSANLAGEKPAATIKAAKKYFGDKVDFYVDTGKLISKPSTLLEIDGDGKINVLRQGAEKNIKQYLQ